MYVLILTGGIGSGKSTVARHLERRGAIRLDLDRLASEVRGQAGVVEGLVAAFGGCILTSEGKVDATSLAKAAFVDEEHTLQLNAIMHPAIERALERRLVDVGSSCAPVPLVVVEVPLLTSADGYRRLADEVMTVSAPETLRAARVVARGMAEPDVHRRMAQQMGDDERAALADVVVSNDQGLEVLLGQVDTWFDARMAAGWAPRRHPGAGAGR